MIGSNIRNNEEKKPNSRKLEKLKDDFPEFFSKDGEFRMDRFKEFLEADEIDVSNEGYELNFLGKSYARYQSSLESETFIAPDIDHNEKDINKDSENMYIVGDNIDALRHLLKSYTGKIKCIYIDPPYNTGSDGFVYPDNFKFDKDEMAHTLGISDDEAKRILDMAGSSTDSAWLTFMYPRLELARELLSDDGVIFISIDDNEQANLKLICDEILGESNFIGMITVETADGVFGTRASGLDTSLVKVKDYVLVYSNNRLLNEFKPLYMPTAERFDTHYSIMVDQNLKRLRLLDYIKENNELNYYFSKYKLKPSLKNITKIMEIDKEFNDIIVYDLSDKIYQDVSFTLNIPEEVEARLSTGKIIKWNDYLLYKTKNGKGTIRYLKPFKESLRITDDYFPEYRRSVAIGDLWKDFDNDMKNIADEGSVYFDTRKPVRLIKQLIKWSNIESDSMIIDFFSGSATTAHSIMEINAENNTNHKYIMVQIPEKIDKSKPAYKSGFKTIDEIGRKRIESSAEKIKEETGADIDYGYKLFYLEDPESETLDKLIDFKEEIKLLSDDMVSSFDNDHSTGKEAILTTWVNEDGYGLIRKPETYMLNDYEASLIDNTIYLIDEGLKSEDLKILVRDIEDGSLNINRVVIYLHSFSFHILQEIRTNIKALKNSKNINLVERF